MGGTGGGAGDSGSGGGSLVSSVDNAEKYKRWRQLMRKDPEVRLSVSYVRGCVDRWFGGSRTDT